MIDKIKIYAWNMPIEYSCIIWCMKLFLAITVNIILGLFSHTTSSYFIDVIWIIVLTVSVVWIVSDALADDRIHWLPNVETSYMTIQKIVPNAIMTNSSTIMAIRTRRVIISFWALTRSVTKYWFLHMTKMVMPK